MPDPIPSSSRESLWTRLLWMLLIGALTSVTQALLNLLAVMQIIIMALNTSRPNAEIAAFGKRMGLWQAKASRFQTAASDDKPWPWSPLE